MSELKALLDDKRDSFRVEIRRKHINQITKARRMIVQLQRSKQMAPYTIQQRQEVIRKAALILTGVPNEEWRIQVSQLKHQLSRFQGNFDQVSSSGILYSVCQLFKPQYDGIKWRGDVAHLIANLIACNQSPGITSQILSYDILRYVCRLFEFSELAGPQDRQNCLYLLSNVAGDSMAARIKVLEAGSARVAVCLLNNAKTAKQVELLLWFVSNLVKSDDGDADTTPPYNMISVFLPYMDKYIMEEDQSILTDVLNSLNYMMKGKHYKVSNVFHSSQIRFRLVELLTHSSKEVRILSRSILLIFFQSKMGTQFMRLGVLDSMLTDIKSHQFMRKEYLQYCKLIIKILQGSEDNIVFFTGHPIFDYVYEWIHQSQDETVKAGAIRIFSTIFLYANTSLISKILRKRTQTLQLIFKCLQCSRQLVLEALNCFLDFVKAFQGCYTATEDNRGAAQLQRRFNFSSHCIHLLDSQDRYISKAATKLIELISQSCQL